MKLRKNLLLALVVGPALAALVAAARSALLADERTTVCWILRNGAVSFAGALDPACPLRPYERIERVHADGGFRPVSSLAEIRSLAGSTGGFWALAASGSRRREVWISFVDDPRQIRIAQLGLAALVTLSLLSFGASVVQRSNSPMAAPIALLCGMGAVYTISALSRSQGDLLDLSWVVAFGVVPATLSHLALVFPRQRRLLERVPGILAFLYGIAALLIGFEYLSLLRNDILWATVDRIAATWTVGAAVALGTASWLTLRESCIERERAHARLYLAGSGLLVSVILALLLGAEASLSPLARESISAWTILALVLVPFAASRYGLVDAPLATRWAVSYVLYTAAAVSSGYVLLLLLRPWVDWSAIASAPALVLGASFFALVALDRIRGISWNVGQKLATPWTSKLEVAQARLARESGRCEDSDSEMRILVAAIGAGIDVVGSAGFLPMSPRGWRLAALAGQGQDDDRAALAAASMLASRGERDDVRSCEILALDRLETSCDRSLDRVELLIGLCKGAELIGLVLVSPRRHGGMFSSEHLEFLHQACTRTALAIANLGLRYELLMSARLAAIGGTTASLLHDLGRPIGEILIEASDLRAEESGGKGTEEGLLAIERLARECLERLGSMMTTGVGPQTRSDAPIDLATVIEAAADRTTRLNGGQGPLLRLSQDLPLVRDPQSLQRVIENLVENAMQASRGEAMVQVYAVHIDGFVTIQVIDEGEGMDQEGARRAFEPFYSRRGGSGIGLTVSRRIVEGLGGSIELESTLGKGTRVTVRIPIEPTGI